LFTPVAGEIVAINDGLNADAALVNREPFSGGWMLKMKLEDASATANLMDAAAYEALTAEG
jgi:glycine cleavage system H protein